AEMIAGLDDQHGRVAIPGFSQRGREVGATERQELRCGSLTDEQIMKDLDIPLDWGEPGYSLFERMTIRPALIVNGIVGGYSGPGIKTVIPKKGVAWMSMRVVPAQ